MPVGEAVARASNFDISGIWPLPIEKTRTLVQMKWRLVYTLYRRSVVPKRMLKHTIAGVTFSLLLGVAPSFAETIGGPSVTARVEVDTAVGDVYIYNGFFTVAGAQVTSFQFFNNNPADTNWITPVILTLQSGRTYQITGVGQSVQNTGAGVQTYPFTLVSGSATVGAGQVTFGWWNGQLGGSGNAGVIQFDGNGSGPGFGESCAVANTNPCFVSTVAAGNTVPFANDYNGFPNSSNILQSPNGRNYSVQVTTSGIAAAPAPALSQWGLILLAALLVGTTVIVLRRSSRGDTSEPQP
jgi:hypothetical protein